MKSKSETLQRRRRVAMLLGEGMSANEIAKALKLRWDVVDEDRKLIQGDPNNIDYISPKRALGRLLDNYDILEKRASEHLQLALDQGKLDSANRWFETIRRIAEDRGKVLHQIGLLNRAAREAPSDEADHGEPRVSTRARELMGRIALAEKLGHPWRCDLVVEDTTALEPVPDPDFRPSPRTGGTDG